MEIERINENTIKFYISYMDIEDRGFGREEIWYNRERSEQLFWEMMEEVNHKEEDFAIEGPLWIQVQAMEKGLEVIVTRANVDKNGDQLELPENSSMDVPVDKNIAKMLEDKAEAYNEAEDESATELVEESMTMMTVSFKDFEDVIQLSHYISEINGSWDIETVLYFYKDQYILHIEFDNAIDSEQFEDVVSIVYEFADDTDVTVHLLEEYGKEVFNGDVFSQVQSYFPV